jgi:ubiquinone/menaquinone biosynthesis C-methylase UbiE
LTIDDQSYFDYLAELEAAHWWSRGMWRLASYWLDEALQGRRGLRALDVGCGTGGTAVRLRRRPEIDLVIGLEPSPAALAHARLRHRHFLTRGTALALPFLDQSFDLITFFDVLQHVPEGTEARALAELCRVLRPGGMVMIRSNAQGWGRSRREVGLPDRLDQLVALVTGAGLRVRRASYANCLPALAQEVRQWWSTRGDTPHHRPPHPPGGGLPLRVPPRWQNWLLGAVSAAEAIVAGPLGARLPFGHSTMALGERGRGGSRGSRDALPQRTRMSPAGQEPVERLMNLGVGIVPSAGDQLGDQQPPQAGQELVG